MYDRERVYCGNVTPPLFESRGAQLKMTYNLATSADSRGFQLTYQIEGMPPLHQEDSVYIRMIK